jgi:DNA-binding beta-propeller fold protein YncE
MRRFLLHTVVLCLTLSLAEAQRTSSDTLVWPKPPAAARIKFLYSVSGQQDVLKEKSFWRGLLDSVFGEDREDPRFVRPQGVAVSTEGVIFVTDIGDRAVHIVDLNERTYEVFRGDEDKPFLSPVGIAVSPSGELFVADSERKEVLVFDADRSFVRSIIQGLRRPTQVAFAGGTLYVTDTEANQVVLFTPEGRELTRWGRRGIEHGEFNYPTSLAVADLRDSAKGNRLFVVDAMNFRIQQLGADGHYADSFGKLGDHAGDFARPKGIALDSDRHIYVVDALYDVVQLFSPAGVLLLAFGGSGNAFGNFSLPAGLAIDANDRLYVVDSGNRRIQVFQYLK